MIEIIRELNETTLKRVVRVIDDGGIISFPTETVYALAADASNSEAVKKIYTIKRRFVEKALPILVGDVYQAHRIAEFDERAKKLAFHLFPGPITLVLRAKKNNLSKNVNSHNSGTIGIRMPNSLPAIKILQAAGRPLVGTSANISNQENAIDGYQVLNDFDNQIDLLVDKGATKHGIPSTIIDLTTEKTKILREGVIPRTIIEEILDEATF